jgi:hypothetical protein
MLRCKGIGGGKWKSRRPLVLVAPRRSDGGVVFVGGGLSPLSIGCKIADKRDKKKRAVKKIRANSWTSKCQRASQVESLILHPLPSSNGHASRLRDTGKFSLLSRNSRPPYEQEAAEHLVVYMKQCLCRLPPASPCRGSPPPPCSTASYPEIKHFQGCLSECSLKQIYQFAC